MCPDKVQTLYTVPLFWSGAGACSWPKNTTRDKRSDMINAAFALAVTMIPLNPANTPTFLKQVVLRKAH